MTIIYHFKKWMGIFRNFDFYLLLPIWRHLQRWKLCGNLIQPVCELTGIMGKGADFCVVWEEPIQMRNLSMN